MNQYNEIIATKEEKNILKSIILNWSTEQIKSGANPKFVINEIKTNKGLQHQFSQECFKQMGTLK